MEKAKILDVKCHVDAFQVEVCVEAFSTTTVTEFAKEAFETAAQDDERFVGRIGIVKVDGKSVLGSKLILGMTQGKEDKISVVAKLLEGAYRAADQDVIFSDVAASTVVKPPNAGQDIPARARVDVKNPATKRGPLPHPPDARAIVGLVGGVAALERPAGKRDALQSPPVGNAGKTGTGTVTPATKRGPLPPPPIAIPRATILTSAQDSAKEENGEFAKLRLLRNHVWDALWIRLKGKLNSAFKYLPPECGVKVVSEVKAIEVGSTKRGVDVGLADLDKMVVVELEHDIVKQTDGKFLYHGERLQAKTFLFLSYAFHFGVEQLLMDRQQRDEWFLASIGWRNKAIATFRTTEGFDFDVVLAVRRPGELFYMVDDGVRLEEHVEKYGVALQEEARLVLNDFVRSEHEIEGLERISSGLKELIRNLKAIGKQGGQVYTPGVLWEEIACLLAKERKWKEWSKEERLVEAMQMLQSKAVSRARLSPFTMQETNLLEEFDETSAKNDVDKLRRSKARATLLGWIDKMVSMPREELMQLVLFQPGVVCAKPRSEEAELGDLRKRLTRILVIEPKCMFVSPVQGFVWSLREGFSNFKMEGFGGDEDMGRLKLDSGFVKLSISKWSRELEEEAVKGDKQKVRELLDKETEKVELPKIWDEKSRRRVVVQGAAGAGKTTLLRWIAFEWSRGLLWKDRFEAVVFLKLRNVDKKAKTLVDVMVSGMLNGDRQMEGVVRDFLAWTKKHRVLWLMDGWDEISVVEGSSLWKVQKAEQLEEGRVEFLIAGSRPEAVKSILEVQKDSMLFVQGFTDDGIWRFVRTYFGEYDAKEIAAKPLLGVKQVFGRSNRLKEVMAVPSVDESKREGKFSSLLKSSWLWDAWLWDACHSPLMLRFVCLVAPQLVGLERANRATVYKLVVDHFMHPFSDEGIVRNELRDQIAEIAWNGYSSGNLLVPEIDLSKHSRFKQLKRCGLLKSEGAIGSESSVFSWVHFTIQEYLAAEHICSDRFKGKVAKELQRCLTFENRNVFFGFVCGIGGRADCWSEWFPKSFGLDLNLDLKDAGPVLWIEEGGKKLEDVLVKFWRDLFALYGGAMLRAAAREGCVNVVKFLIAQKVDVNCKGQYSVINIAGGHGHFEVVKCLIEHGANDSERAFSSAALGGHLKIVKYLFERGVEDSSGVISCVCHAGHFEVLKYLIENGGRQDFGQGLQMASAKGYLEMVKYLIEHGAKEYNSALNHACGRGQLEVVKYLIKCGANVVSIATGVHCLFAASRRGHLEVVKYLLEEGAKVSAVDRIDGFRRSWIELLLGASQNNLLECVRYLLEAGAPVDLGLHNLNAWHIAKWADRDDVAELIEAKFGKQSDAKSDLWKNRKSTCTSKFTDESKEYQMIWHAAYGTKILVNPAYAYGVKILMNPRRNLCWWCKEHCHKDHETGSVRFECARCECAETKNCQSTK